MRIEWNCEPCEPARLFRIFKHSSLVLLLAGFGTRALAAPAPTIVSFRPHAVRPGAEQMLVVAGDNFTAAPALWTTLPGGVSVVQSDARNLVLKCAPPT